MDTGNYKLSIFLAFQVSHSKTKSMISNIVLIATLVLSCFPSESAAGGVYCTNPIVMGELRVMKSRQCVDIRETSGGGDVETYICDGRGDQQLILCEDGTIRNKKAPQNCLTEIGTGISRDVRSVPCQVYPAIPSYQKWRLGKSKTFVDNGGIEQEASEIVNVRSGRYLDVTGSSGQGNIRTYLRDRNDDQLFYFRSRGKLVAYGSLLIEKSGLCLDISGSSGGIENGYNVLIWNCDNSPDQYFLFYENGELVSKKSGLCVDIAGSQGSGNIGMHPCLDEPDQMWLRPYQYCHGDYCSFVSKKSGKCLEGSGSDAGKGTNILAYECDVAPDQRFKWVTEKWVTPTATWSQVGCNQNGEVTHTISNTVSYTTSVTSSIATEVSSTIEADVIFGSVSVSVSVTASLAQTWEESQSGTKQITFTCETYDSGKSFTRGCMWQLKLTTKQATNDDLLTWKPLIVKCTSNNQAPKCPPFTKCKDEACTMCEELKILKKKSFDESLPREKALNIE